MYEKVKYIFAILLLALINQAMAQEISDSSISTISTFNEPERKHSLYAEIGGRTFFVGSFNYERQLLPRFSIGAGVGIISLQRGKITRINDNLQETGKYFDLSTTQLLYGNYFLGRNQHRLLITAGFTNFLFSYRRNYPSEVVVSREAQIKWNAGLGYQFSTEKMFFRLTGVWSERP